MEKRSIDWGSAAKKPNDHYLLRLYIAGTSPRSMRAIANVRKICQSELSDRYELDVVDIFQHPEMAKEAQIVAAPTLIKELPLPLRRFIGDLSDSDKVVLGMKITAANAAAK